MNSIYVIIIATKEYFPLGLRAINQFLHFYKGDRSVFFRFISDQDPKEFIDYANIEHVYMNPDMDFESYTMKKIEEVQKIENTYGYYLILDADTKINKPFSDRDFISDFTCLMHFNNRILNKKRLPFETNPKSSAYFNQAHYKSRMYYHACMIGGSYENIKELSDNIITWWQEDKVKGIRAIWEDESYLNRYVNTIKKPDKILDPDDLFCLLGDKGYDDRTISGNSNPSLFNRFDGQYDQITSSIKKIGKSLWDIEHGKFVEKNQTEDLPSIFIFGDSNVGYFSNKRDILDNSEPGDRGIHKTVYNGYNVYLIWEHAKIAYGITNEYLSEISSEIKDKIKPNSIIVFSYGTMDCVRHISRHNNTETIVDRYVDECMSFSTVNNKHVYFMMPIVPVRFLKNTKKFESHCAKKIRTIKANSPIQVVGNIIDRDYKTEDKYEHLSVKDSETAFRYVLDLVIENYTK